jgi:putative oxidoreductase
MMNYVNNVRKWYLLEIWALDHVKHIFLLVLRLYFGWGFMSAGLGKLLNVETQAVFFANWGIPLPTLNVYLAGTTETVCGFLLLVGAASRIITIPLIGTMFVAYLTAHTEQLYALWGNTPLFFKAPPFPYLFTCCVVLFFGPGLLSVDGLLKSVLECKHHGTKSADKAKANSRQTSSMSPDLISHDLATFSSTGEP